MEPDPTTFECDICGGEFDLDEVHNVGEYDHLLACAACASAQTRRIGPNPYGGIE